MEVNETVREEMDKMIQNANEQIVWLSDKIAECYDKDDFRTGIELVHAREYIRNALHVMHTIKRTL